MDHDRSKCLNAGCNDFVTKPIQMDKLFKALGRYMTVTPVTQDPAKVDAAAENVTVPRQYVKDGKIVLNVSFSATQMLKLGNDFVSFEARFGGVGFAVQVPVRAILGIYARETGQGMIFPEGDADPDPIQIHTFADAGHAFFSVDRPSYRPEAAVDGWRHIDEFFATHLKG